MDVQSSGRTHKENLKGEATVPTNTRPWFPLYAADFLSDPKVVVLNNEELGIYFRLLCYHWIDGSLPDDDLELATLSGWGRRW